MRRLDVYEVMLLVLCARVAARGRHGTALRHAMPRLFSWLFSLRFFSFIRHIAPYNACLPAFIQYLLSLARIPVPTTAFPCEC